MSDKSWMLNAKAIAAARKCISIVDAELDVKLKLSHPDFLELLVDYAELNESNELHAAIAVLAQFAPANVTASLTGTDVDAKIINLESKSIFIHKKRAPKPVSQTKDEAIVKYKGKDYPRYSDGMEFKGLYRGQPRYA